MHTGFKGRLLVTACITLGATVSEITVAGGVTAELRSAAVLQPTLGTGESLPTAPAGGQVIGAQLWTCDALAGIAPAVALTSGIPDPALAIATTGNVRLPISPSTTPASCGQIVYDGNGNLYVTQGIVDTKVTPSAERGVLRLSVDPTTGIALGESSYIATTAGLDGNQPTAAALGPDGNLYVAFLKSGNIKRIVNPAVGTTQVVQSVGSTPNGHPGRSLAFVGSDLYIGSADAFSVIHNATSTACTGGCNAVSIPDGFTGVPHVSVATDGFDSVYFAVSNQVWRYSVSTATYAFVSQGGVGRNGANAATFNFVPAKSNLLTLDAGGDLWIGDDTSNGTTTGAGRLWSIPQTTLASVTGSTFTAGTNMQAIVNTLHGPWLTMVGSVSFEPTFNADGTFTATVQLTSGSPITTDAGTWTLTPPHVIAPFANPQAHLAIVDAVGTTLLEGDALLTNVDQLALMPATEGLTAPLPLSIGLVVLTKFAP